MPMSVGSHLPHHPPFESLTPRRREILELVTKGLTNAEIGSACAISAGTVRIHVSAILEHLQLSNRTEAAAAYVAYQTEADHVSEVLRRPALAVLALRPLDDDPRTKDLACALTEDLASLFARWCWFPVISTASSAHDTWRGRPLTEVAHALGARFLVSGSVRATSCSLRVSLHVDDHEVSEHVFADQRDIAWTSLFEQADEFCRSIVAVTYATLIRRVLATAVESPLGSDLPAWELAHQAMRLRTRRERSANEQAAALLERAIAREPALVLAHYAAGLVAYDAILNQWGPAHTAMTRLEGAAAQCHDMAAHRAEAYFLEGRYLQTSGEWGAAIEPLRTAIVRNPSFAVAHAALAQSLQASGAAEESLVRMGHAMRLGPRTFHAGLATLHFMQGNYQDAYACALDAVARAPRYAFARALAAASAWHLGEVADGRAQLRELRRVHPDFRSASFAATFGSQVDPVERLSRALDAMA